jgi:hypothetical protein
LSIHPLLEKAEAILIDDAFGIPNPFKGTGVKTTALITPAKTVQECIYVNKVL